jgi:hypothetical protein
MLTYFAPYNVFEAKHEKYSRSDRGLIAILPNMAMAWALKILIVIENGIKGIRILK